MFRLPLAAPPLFLLTVVEGGLQDFENRTGDRAVQGGIE